MLTEPGTYLPLHDATGTLRGVFVEAALWERVKKDVLPLLDAAANKTTAPEPEPLPEPLADWETLLAYWDFPYPPTYDLACTCCGSQTEDWRADEPRKFRLTAANLGGLASFQCQGCKARILKRHFKKHVNVECQPYVTKS